MGRPSLDISEEERYDRHKECCKKYKLKRMETDPEYKEKVRNYNINYSRNIVKNGNAAKELRIKEEEKFKEFKELEELEEATKALQIKLKETTEALKKKTKEVQKIKENKYIHTTVKCKIFNQKLIL